MNVRLEEVLHGESNCSAARLEEGLAGRNGGVIGRNAYGRDETSAMSRSSTAIVREGVCALIAGRACGRTADERLVVVCEVHRVVGVASQVELAEWVIQEVNRRDTELQLLPFCDLEVLEQRQVAVKVGWSTHVRPFQRALHTVRGHAEASWIEPLS